MTPKFWKHLITNGNGSETRFVAEQDREWAERELEDDLSLLSYRAQNHNFNLPCFAVLPSESCSGSGRRGHNNKKGR